MVTSCVQSCKPVEGGGARESNSLLPLRKIRAIELDEGGGEATRPKALVSQVTKCLFSSLSANEKE